MTIKRARGIWAFRLLTLEGLALLAAAHFLPVWWVSPKAPNHPPETFPQGVRVEFFFDHVGNGCALRNNEEVEEEGAALDCAHGMNTINHFIGMHPISAGARYELASAPYVFPVMGLALPAFAFYRGRFWWLLAIPATLTPLAFVID